MILALVIIAFLLLFTGIVVGAFEHFVLGTFAVLVGIGMLSYGLILLEREEDAARTACAAEGGTYKEFRGDDVCFAPGTVLR